ncbi:DUF1972 domain-containing protein [Acidovorax sp. SDU_ACID1]|uniref:DUF1972 domain-containing protein n=1 Tax=Acidovorax sp. SDU_ACID1 TaxID=3136632 RepID=UPI003872F555
MTQACSTGVQPPALRIAILGTRGIPAGYGGFETFAEQLATRLVARGHRVTVYAEADGAPSADSDHLGVRVRYRRRPRWGAASVLAYDCACLWDARKGYDLVYMLGYGAAWACWWPRLSGVPVWINVDGLEWARSKWSAVARIYLRAMEWVASRAATRTIADAQAIADRFRSLYPRGRPAASSPMAPISCRRPIRPCCPAGACSPTATCSWWRGPSRRITSRRSSRAVCCMAGRGRWWWWAE